MTKKKLGRPYKAIHKMDARLSVRISSNDKEEAKQMAYMKGFKCLSDYINYLIKQDDPNKKAAQ